VRCAYPGYKAPGYMSGINMDSSFRTARFPCLRANTEQKPRYSRPPHALRAVFPARERR